jgi:hypothetical protein
LPIILWGNEILANTRTTTDIEVETGAIFVQGFRPLAERKDPLDQAEGISQQSYICIGAIVFIFGAV